MTGRDRILIALDGAAPDRVPCALSFYHVDLAALAPSGFAWDDVIDVDFLEFPSSPEDDELQRIAEPFPPDTRLGTAAQVATYARWQYRPRDADRSNPLARARTLDDLRSFRFPEPTARPNDTQLARQVQDLHRRGLAAGGNLPHLGGELFETAWRLRGLENFLVDLVRRPDWAHCLLDRLAERAGRHATTLARAGIDVLALDDDVGMPGTMMIGPATWRAFFKPRLAGIIRAARTINPDLRVLFHSDGYFEPIIADLVEIGVDAINPLQPEYMDAASIRRRFGTRPALWGTVGRQTTFSFSTPDEIRREVKSRIDTLGRAGLVICPAYDIDEPDIPWENIAAFLEAAREEWPN